MVETTGSITSVLRQAAGDAHVLPTRILRTDNRTEFINRCVQVLLQQAGIRHERSCPHTSHQNGVAERAIGKLMSIVRTMISAASVRPTMWGEAMMTAAHVLNRLPCTANTGNASPFQIRYARLPAIRHLQPWGITVYIRRTNPQSKVIQRADTGILVGYGHEVTGQKGWRVYVPALRRVVTSSHVTFHSNLDESVQRRHPTERSVVLPQLQEYTTAPITISQSDISTQSSAALLPPSSISVPGPVPSPPVMHPICVRPSGPAPIRPSALMSTPAAITQPASAPPTSPANPGHAEPSASMPVTRSVTARKASWADIVSKADKDVASDNPEPIPRPRGRPPANHQWDGAKGEYVPVNRVTATPEQNAAVIFVAMNSDLVADHQTPTTCLRASCHRSRR